jgi:type VII secretion-associated serine protease mycosin
VRTLRIGLSLAVSTLALATSAPMTVPVLAAPPKGACSNQSLEPAHPVERLLPWAQQLLEPQRAWPFSTGAGVTVAVIDSGVDADHPQLRRPGKVLPGQDFFLQGKLRGNYDCISHGTGVAGIIAADSAHGVGFQGIAPGARILPVRVTERDLGSSGQSEVINENLLAEAIVYAVTSGAQVINLSMAGTQNQQVVRKAIAYAVARDVVVVAAVGNQQPSTGPNLPSYPAQYPGVIGVGAIDSSGARLAASQVGDYVDLVAPGQAVLATTRVGGHAYEDGTSFAAPFVSGTAALVRSAWPKLSAAEVAQRLTATATPARGGRGSVEYGAGIIDPYRAVTEGMNLGPAQKAPAAIAAPPDQHALAVAGWWRSRGLTARITAALAIGSTAVVTLVFALLTLGRRRRWIAARRWSHEHSPIDEPLPPESLFR